MHRSDRRSLFSLVAAATLLAATFSHAAADTSTAAATSAQAAAALASGRALLRRNRADEALPQLESALAIYARAGDASGAAAARDQIGDIYQRQGQYGVALQNYQPAYEAFRAKGDCPNAALLLVKIGETHYLAGDAEGSRAAFARVTECGTKGGAAAGGTTAGGDDSRGALAFLPAGAAAGFASCSAPPRPDNQAGNGGTDGPPAKEPTLGHGPTARSRTVRMDLRVVDQNGNPVPGVKAKLWSERQENGFLCECTHYTDTAGKVLMDPIHFSKTLNLDLAAKGFEPLTLRVDPKALDQPFRAVMRAKGAAQAAQTAARASDAARAAGPPAPSCADLFRLFVAFGFAELGSARADFESGRLDSARSRYANVLAAAGNNSPAGSLLAARLFRAVARTSLGDVAFKQGRFDEAAALYREAAEGARRDGRLELAWAAQRGLARTLWAQAAQSPAAAAKREEALQTYRVALSTVETLFAGGLRADEARTNFLSTTRDLFEDAASAFADSALAVQAPAPARPAARRVGAHAYLPPPRPLEGRALAYAAEAFRIVEQGRARSLLDLIGETRAEITEGLPADLVARRAANAARQQEIADALRGVRAASDAAPALSVAQLEAELERLSVERDSIENQIRVASPRYHAHVRAQPLSVAEVQRQVLDEGTALVEYSLGRERSYLFALTRAGLMLHKLPARAEIEAQAVGLRRQLIPAGTRRAIAGVDVRGIGEELQSQTAGRGIGLGGAAAAPQAVAAYAAAAHALYRTLLAPAAAFAGARRLLVVADGALNFVPFEALVTAPGGVDYPGLHYLVKTHEVVYAPSASIVAAVRAQPRPAAAGGGMLVVADPVFDASDSRARGRGGLKTKEAGAQRAALQSALADVTSLNLAGLKLIRLAGTRDEAERIAALARAQGGAADVWLDFDASEANLSRRELSRYRVLHFATHGLLDAERPRFTGLALSLVGDAEADGFLRVEEVFNLKLGAPLVVLSACETGLGRERRGEGVIGLTRAFMYAGAPTVGVSLWSVGDRSTAELMPDFYKRLLASQGRAPAAAMRAAQRQMIDGKRYSAPFYWAPFVLVGDWR